MSNKCYNICSVSSEAKSAVLISQSDLKIIDKPLVDGIFEIMLMSLMWLMGRYFDEHMY